MFETHDNRGLPVSEDDQQAGNQHWKAISIPKAKPFLVLSIACLDDQTIRMSTFLINNLDEALSYGNRQNNRIEKIQLMEPASSIDGGWRLHDILSIRTHWPQVFVEVDGNPTPQRHYREEYHTAEGRCLTFSNLSDEDPICESSLETVYSAALQNPDWKTDDQDNSQYPELD